MNRIKLEELIEDGATIKRIAAEVSSSQTNVRYWLKKFDLKTKRGPGGKIPKDLSVVRKCSHCGETNPFRFYGHKRSICGKCHAKYTLALGQMKREEALKLLGGKCLNCGFNTYKCSLDIHHLDPSKKDIGFVNYRSWSWSKLKKELEGCVLLCKNCHSAVHNSLIVL